MIREAKLNDVNEIVQMLHGYYKEAIWHGVEFSPNKLARSIVEGIVDTEQFIYVVEKSNKIVGFASNELVSPAYSEDKVMENRLLYLSPEWRKGSLGLSLIRQMERDAKEVGAKYFYIGVTSGIHSDRTARLYQKLGFDRIGYEYRKEI